jgi:short-subunit dehydrogenase
MTRNFGTALITGASSGIGAVYANRLARRGYDLILVARNKERLDELASKLASDTGRDVRAIAADLRREADLAKIESVLKEYDAISMLVNNAGVGATGPLLKSNVEKMSEMVSLNVTALMRLTYAAVPGFVARRRGTVINISSIVGVAPEILNGVYGGTKAFVLAFSQSLKSELKDTGVTVQAVLPGATSTEFWEIAGTPLSNLPSEIVMSAENMVDAALTGLELGELITIPSLPNVEEWNAYEDARQKLMPNLSRAVPAGRYQAGAGH